jgi:hypothetical protein
MRRKFTREEDDIIRAYYPTLGGKIIRWFPGRTKHHISARAQRLGINMKGYRPREVRRDEDRYEFYCHYMRAQDLAFQAAMLAHPEEWPG